MENECYDLEELHTIFSLHEKKSVIERLKMIESFKENNPDQDIPLHLRDDFNFPKAIKTIIKELIDLRNEKRIHS